MSDKDDLIGRGIRSMKGWMLRVSHGVASTGNTDARRPGERRFGLADRRLLARAEPSDRRLVERREN